jgi:hypothetical protein
MDGDLTRSPGATRQDPLIPTVFHEPWWLEAATGGRYSEITVSGGGKLVGRFPFVMSRSFAGLRVCGMPELTHFLGPAIDAGGGAPVNRSLRYDGILRELLNALPACAGFHQQLHRGTADTLMFQDLGYRTQVHFTFDIEPAGKSVLWSRMRDKTRNAIRRAEDRFRVIEMHDPREFDAIYRAHLLEHGRKNHYTRIVDVCQAALANDRGRILAAVDGAGQTMAAIVYVWDWRAAYYLLSTRSLASGSGAVSRLIWEAIQDAARRGLVFDFDGVAASGSRIFYSGFGGTAVPRYVVYRHSLMHRAVTRICSPFRGSVVNE